MEKLKDKLNYNFNFSNWFLKTQEFSMILAGKRRSGKTTLLKYLIKYYFSIIFGLENIILVKDSDYDKENYHHYLLQTNIIPFNPTLLFILAKYQKNLKEIGKSQKILIIFDDCMNLNKLRNSTATETLFEMFFNGRHMDISFVFSSQYTSLIYSSWIANTDLIIAKNVLSENFLENIRRNFAAKYTKTQFIGFMEKIYKENKYNNVIFDGDDHSINVKKINLYLIQKKLPKKIIKNEELEKKGFISILTDFFKNKK